MEDPEKFWLGQAANLHWHKKPTRALKMGTKKLPGGIEHPTWEWFPDGEISTCYNQVDRHVLAGHGDSPAIYYDSPVTCSKATITYNQLLAEVETLAGVLREAGVTKGDVVLCYSELM
jgi:propionyl-CoA synthetase